MKKSILYFTIAGLMVLASCKKKADVTPVNQGIEMDFVATTDGSDAKTHLVGNKVCWDASDRIRVNEQFVQLIAGAGTPTATFHGVVTPYGGNKFFAGYPAEKTLYTPTAEHKMTFGIPSSQHSFDHDDILVGEIPMGAYGQGAGNKMTLHFHNASNILKLQLWGDGSDASKITRMVITSSKDNLTGNVGAEPIGADSLTFSDVISNQGNQITVDCGTGVLLSTDENAPTPLYVIIPRIKETCVLVVRMYGANGKYQQNIINVNEGVMNRVNYIFTTSTKKVVATVPEGALPGVFSTSADDVIYFSQGNLQYLGLSESWKFADRQYDVLGDGPDTETSNEGNVDLGASYSNNYNTGSGVGGPGETQADKNAARDLFGWGTSGFQDVRDNAHTWENNYQPYSTSNTPVESSHSAYYINRFGYGPDFHSETKYNLTTGSKSDWGYQKIANGGDAYNFGWYTLAGDTDGEWKYLLETRTTSTTGEGMTAGARYALVSVDGIIGLLIFPDSYVWNNATMGTAPTPVNTTAEIAGTYTAEQFVAIEAGGAAFLPAAGLRVGSSLSDVNTQGYYWSASTYKLATDPEGAQTAYNFSFGTGSFYTNKYEGKCDGCQVRLAIPVGTNSGTTDPFNGEDFEIEITATNLISHPYYGGNWK